MQKGIRWIPNYKITLDGDGSALIELQATLINELADLENVTANLVVGVPRFEFDHTRDPIALQDVAARLGQYFQSGSQTAFALSNAIMSQTTRMGEVRRPAARTVQPDLDLGPEVGGAKNEDLFVFTVENLSLGKGERMVLPVTSFTIPYADVYQLDVSMTPPTEVWRQFND